MFYFVTQKSPYLKDFYYICNYTRDYNVLIISTIVDVTTLLILILLDYNVLIISTIVDWLDGLREDNDYNVLIISTIVD